MCSTHMKLGRIDQPKTGPSRHTTHVSCMKLEEGRGGKGGGKEIVEAPLKWICFRTFQDKNHVNLWRMSGRVMMMMIIMMMTT